MTTKKRTGKKVVKIARGAHCEDFLALLNEYVDGEVNLKVCKEIESHLAKCDPCRVVVDNVRKTITLYQKGGPCELPLKFRRQLHACLREHWQKSHTGLK